MNITPQKSYEERLASGQLQPDPAQAELVAVLDHLYTQLLAAPTPRRWFGRKPKSHAQNLYIHGEVGRGKSMAMDLMVACLPAEFPYRRVHFHAFMAEIHHRLHTLRQTDTHTADALKPIAMEYAKNLRLLCLDEFQAQDIADAMILSRLFTLMLDAGLCVVTTSNRIPDDLYKNGLQRESFLPFIALVKARFRVFQLLSPQDYRMQKLRGNPTYFTPEDNLAPLEKIFRALTTTAPSQSILQVNGREVVLPITASGVAWCSFDALCRQPLGAADYTALASEFHTVFLYGIPRMNREDRNEAKRFVTLIDTLYEHKTRLLCAAASVPDELYTKGDASFEFRRTASRLHEMQSEGYLAIARDG